MNRAQASKWAGTPVKPACNGNGSCWQAYTQVPTPDMLCYVWSLFITIAMNAPHSGELPS
jgi:hypothetical protein